MKTEHYTAKEKKLMALLKEAMEWVSDKPWDDPTHLHKRISEELNLPVSYPESFEEKEDENE